MRVEPDHGPMAAVVDTDSGDAVLPGQQLFQQPDAGGTTDAFDEQGDLGHRLIPTDDVCGQAGIVVLGVKGAAYYTLFIPTALAIEAVQAGAGNNPIDALAATAAKMQFLAVDLIDNQVGRRDRQIAMDAGIGRCHGFRD